MDSSIFNLQNGSSPGKLRKRQKRGKIYSVQQKSKISRSSDSVQPSGAQTLLYLMSVISFNRSILHIWSSLISFGICILLIIAGCRSFTFIRFVINRMFLKLQPVTDPTSLLAKLNSCFRTNFGDSLILQIKPQFLISFAFKCPPAKCRTIYL